MDDEDPKPPETEPEPLETEPEPVGYGHPPRRHRFRPGQSGNPKGRPKKSRGFKSEIAEVLETKIGVPGQPGRITVRKAVLLRQVQKAVNQGDSRAAGMVFNEAHALEEREEARAAEAQAAALSAEDDALIASALRLFVPGDTES